MEEELSEKNETQWMQIENLNYYHGKKFIFFFCGKTKPNKP